MDYPKKPSLADSLAPDLSARPMGWVGAGALATSLVAFGLGAGPIGWGLTAVGGTLMSYQYFPQMDRGAKIWGLAAAVATGAALATLAAPAIALGLGVAAAASAFIGYETQRSATYVNTLRSVTADHEIVRKAQDAERNHEVWKPTAVPPTLTPDTLAASATAQTPATPAEEPKYWQQTVKDSRAATDKSRSA